MTAADKKSNAALTDADTIGRSGLQAQYDSVLRGVDGAQTVHLNPQGYVGVRRRLRSPRSRATRS